MSQDFQKRLTKAFDFIQGAAESRDVDQRVMLALLRRVVDCSRETYEEFQQQTTKSAGEPNC